MKRSVKLKGKLKILIQWPLLLIALMAAMVVTMYTIHVKAGILMLIFFIIYTIATVALYVYNKPLLTQELVSFAINYGETQREILMNLEIPYVLLDEDGKIIWMNQSFSDISHKGIGYRKSITSIFSAITKDKIPKEEESFTTKITFEERDYRVDMQRIEMKKMTDHSSYLETDHADNYLVAVYLFDETELNRFIRINHEQELAVGVICIDNYDEALDSVEEVRRSLLVALIDRKINKYITSLDGIVRKLEKDKYFVVLKRKYLEQMEESKFELLDDVKSVNINNEMAVTLSIGFGTNGATYNQNYEYARTAMDFALGRGGDQAVVKSREKIIYYGGKTKQVEKSTRVKARVKAHALRELIESKDKVVIMGHQIGDVDSFGAAIGIYRAAKTFNKKTHIVINEITTSVRQLIDYFIDNPDYEPDMFLTSNEAIEVMDMHTMLVVVDVNKPSFTECPELLETCKNVVVLDHHRQGSEIIENAVLSYVESYASSTCEMVAEILQYIDDNVKLKSREADCLYGGIIIDTNSFMTKTGVRTFEAAAFLRRNGADVTRVRKMFRNAMSDYKARAEAVRHSEVIYDAFAISVCPSEGIESPTIIGAQAANELLNIIGVKASFVLTEFNNKIYISARSIDEINVQMIMERIGGGGHINTAGAQLETSMEEAKKIVKDLLDKMVKEGDL